jgi:phosphopantothenoylcysteine synthetase/decarboxylase
MPIKAMVLAVMAKATKGDLPSIVFINNLISEPHEETEEEKALKREVLEAKKEELKKVLDSEGLECTDEIELENLATQLMTLYRIAAIMERDNHRDIESQTQKDGSIKLQLSTTNRIYNDLLKDFRADFAAFRVRLLQNKLQNKNLDYIVANDVKTALNTNQNKVTIIEKSGKIIDIDLDTKENIARKILEVVCD